MKFVSLKKNFAFNSLLTVLNIIFPIVTFPYISRVLGPEGIGKVNFAFAYLNFFILFSSLGLPLYGLREVSKVRSDKYKLDKLFSELFLINLIFMIISSVFYIFSIFVISKFNDQKTLFFIMGLQLIFSVISFDWFFGGIENYEYIAKRSMIVKIISIILIFTIIKERDDFINYALITILGLCGSNLFNLIYLKNRINLSFRNINILKHMKPLFILFLSQVSISVYTNIDKIMLGVYKGVESVGFYTTAFRLIKIVLQVIISLNTVLFPRLSYLKAKNENAEYFRLLNISSKFIQFLSFPLIVGGFLLSRDIILIMAGIEFENSILTFRIGIFLLYIIGLSNFFSSQVLLPQGGEMTFSISVMCGAVLNLILNILLIPKLDYNGAMISTTIAEIFVLLMQRFLGKKFFRENEIQIFSISTLKYILASVVFVFVIYILKDLNLICRLPISILSCGLLYIFLLVLMKDQIILLILKTIQNKIGA